ncbi:hypothetical protein pb186bvf_016742 [Paramecium bursaria]
MRSQQLQKLGSEMRYITQLDLDQPDWTKIIWEKLENIKQFNLTTLPGSQTSKKIPYINESDHDIVLKIISSIPLVAQVSEQLIIKAKSKEYIKLEIHSPVNWDIQR